MRVSLAKVVGFEFQVAFGRNLGWLNETFTANKIPMILLNRRKSLQTRLNILNELVDWKDFLFYLNVDFNLRYYQNKKKQLALLIMT